MNSGLKGVLTCIIIVMFASIFVGCESEEDEAAIAASVNSRILSNSDISYETSLTDSISGKKADVYKSKITVNETVIILEGIEAPFDKNELVKDKVVMMNFYEEEILIYEGESGETFIQVSPEDYISNVGYRSVYRPGGFFHTYGVVSAADDVSKLFKSKRSSKKTQLSNSIRNSSSGTRSSSGGGTSFGK